MTPRPWHFSLRLSGWVCGFVLLTALAGLCACNRQKDEGGSAESQAVRDASEQIFYTIKGRIELEDGDDPTGTAVFCAGTSYLAYCDAGGNYVISSVPAGRYTIVAQKPGYATTGLGETVLLPVASGAGPSDVEIPMVELARDPRFMALSEGARQNGGTIVGRVTLTDSRPPDAVRVSVQGADEAVVTDRDGIFSIGDVEAGAQVLVFEREGYEPAERRVMVPRGQIVRLRRPIEMRPEVALIEGRGTILGQVMFLGAGGQVADPVGDATVGIVENGQIVGVGTDGSFVFEDLDPGLYTLIADATGFKLRNKVQVRVGEEPATAIIFLQDARTAVEERGAVRGEIRLADAAQTPLVGIVVALTGSSHMGVTDGAGAFRLTDVPAGTYSLFCSREGYETLQLTGIDIEPGRMLDLGVLEMAPLVEPPRVLFTTPRDGTDDITIEPTVLVRIGFSSKMDMRSVRGALRIEPPVTYTLRRAAASVEAGSEASDLIEVVLRAGQQADQPLEFNTDYRLTLGADATDVQGTPLEEPFQMRFSTGGLRILSVRPPDRSTGVTISGRSAMEIRFNGIVDAETLTDRTIDISPRPTAMAHVANMRYDPATGWSIVQIRLTWRYDTEYRVAIRSGIRTLDGVRFDQGTYRVRFRTQPLPQFDGQ